MASYRIPSLAEAVDLLVAGFRALFPGRNIGARRAYHHRRAQWLGMAMTEVNAGTASVADDVMPDSATGTFAERWGKIAGTGRKGATPARKSNALLVLGDNGTPIPADTELRHVESGLRFKITRAAVMPVEEEILVDVAGIDTGSRTRLKAGEVLEFVAPIPNIEPRAELQFDLDEDGFDIEPEATFKTRYLKALGEASAGGNDADWDRWVTALPGIEQVYVYPNRAGRGTLDLVALHSGSNSDRALTVPEGDDVVAALRKLGPSQLVATGGSLRHLTVVKDAQNVKIAVKPNGDPQWDFDWDDSVVPVITAWDPATRTATLNARPASMKAGDRLCIHGVATAQTGEVLVIESLVAGDQIKLEAAPKVAPANTDTVYAGGPLTAMIRDAVLAHLAGDIVYGGDDGPIPAAVATEANRSIFELKELAQGIGPANPGGKYGSWSGALVQSTLEKIATYARGARDATCEVPAADYEATDYAFPDDLQIGLIVSAEVLIHRAW